MKKFFTTLLISIFFLSGCTGDRCIDADDFGFIKFIISSRYPKEQLSIKQQDNQTAPWVDSEYKVNGQPLTILVKTWDYRKGDQNNESELSAWGPWYGTEKNFHTLSDFCLRLPECHFRDGIMCPTKKKKDADIDNAPCLLKNGVGLYFLIADRGTDPNISESTQRTPKGITRHLGEPRKDYNLYDLTKRGELVPAGGINYQYEHDQTKSANYSQCPLYFKILDKFYDDNNGQYRIVIKSGVSDTRPDPLEFLTNLITAELFGTKKKYARLFGNNQKQSLSDTDQKQLASSNPYTPEDGIVKSVYEKIIKTPGYRLTVSALLTLYVMFTGFSFLIGNVNMSHTELIVRVLKITIVSILLSSSQSWQFFNDYLFVYFVDGVQEILRIIKETSTTGPGSSSLIGLMIAPQTMAKLFSLLFVDPLGFIYIFFYLIALYFIFTLIFKATIIYLTALITIGMIITMAPIFICFMLFGITRSLFENWLRQLISYAIQPIILFTGLAFIAILIRTEIYSTLGFAVCKHDFPRLGTITELFKGNEGLDSSIEGSFFYWWFPSPLKREHPPLKTNILVPVDHTIPDGTPAGKLCLAYECIENRYVEWPFLDPNDPKDQARIDSFANGRFVQLDGLFLIFACIYLLTKFNDIAVAVARFLSNTSGNLTRLEPVGQLAYAPIEKQIDRPMNYVVNSTKKRVSSFVDPWIYKHISLPFEERMQEKVALDALNPNAVQSSVLAEVKRNYGIDYSDVNVNAGEDYTKAIESILNKGKIANASQKATKLANQSYTDLRDSIAHLKYEKSYNALNESQKQEMDALIKLDTKSTLRELASDAKFTRDFQEAYVASHAAMSQRGTGYFGKKFYALRLLQEIQYNKKTKENLRQAKRKDRGEQIYETWTGIKRNLLTAIVGKKVRDAIEGNLTSAEYHDFNYNDSRLRTHREIRQDEARALKAQELNNQINRETRKVQEDILSPEYLARLAQQQRYSEIESYEKLAKAQLAEEIYNKLSSDYEDGHEIEPALMGERFIREKATDQQTRDMIDQIYKKQEQLIKQDRYIRREERYKSIYENAARNINQELDVDAATMDKLHYSTKVLENIEKRKQFIREKTLDYIREINIYRMDAKMSEYVKPDSTK
ncbi:type IV secretion system protein [Candidatus Tisiphia endosymbiont of Nemotelus uliginosus]|uniref:type IV secretion system protein n=1 Tax=Candidatus Tisiphia endosymbiont of Nemotelus uliginosus TaxID=3077926 RepID=UPI0035C89C61